MTRFAALFTQLDFNSIKVRLKLLSEILIIAILIFQFHKGTIKTTLAQEEGQGVQVFQFHKGTIKTSSTRLVMSSIPNFNSIKVRLKPFGVLALSL